MNILKNIFLISGLVIVGTALLVTGAILVAMFALALASPLILIIYLIIQAL